MADQTIDERTESTGIPVPRIPGFTVTGELGRGGMGAVFRARDSRGEEVALKVMTSADASFRERFAREISAAQRIPSPHVVRVLAYGLEPLPFMVTELVDSGSLRSLLDEAGAMPVPLVLRLFDDLLAGLGAAHAEGVLHRDIKPQNLLLVSSGKLKVADFGVARLTDESSLTSTGGVVGTPAYMSPEQALAEPLDGASDLFSAGIVLYEMLTGQHPFRATSPAATLLRITKLRHALASELAPLIPDEVDTLVERLLRARTRRIASASAARAALAPLLQQYGASYHEAAAFLRDHRASRGTVDARLRAAEVRNARRALVARRADVAAATTARLARAWPRDAEVVALLRDVQRTAPVKDNRSAGALALLNRADKEEAPIPTLREAARRARGDGDTVLERRAHARILQLVDDEDSASALRPFSPPVADGAVGGLARQLMSALSFPWRAAKALGRGLVGIAPFFQDAKGHLGGSGITAIALLILLCAAGSCAMCARCSGTSLLFPKPSSASSPR